MYQNEIFKKSTWILLLVAVLFAPLLHAENVQPLDFKGMAQQFKSNVSKTQQRIDLMVAKEWPAKIN